MKKYISIIIALIVVFSVVSISYSSSLDDWIDRMGLKNMLIPSPTIINNGKVLMASSTASNGLSWETVTGSGIQLTDISSIATGLTYNNTTGVFSLATGYEIPTTASTSVWNKGGTTYIVTTVPTTSTASIAFQNITGLNWAMTSNTRYDIECKFSYNARAITIGLGISWTASTSPIIAQGQMVSNITNMTVGGTMSSSTNDQSSSTTASSQLKNNTAIFEGFWEAGATNSNFQMRFRPETATAGGIVINKGSWCKYTSY